MTERQLIVTRDPAALARRVADWLVETALAKQGAFAVALSGGSTPRRLYELLAETPYLARMPWDQIHWFWGDERFVPQADKLSNYKMVWDAMLSRAPIPLANVHAVPTEGTTPEKSAAMYQAELQRFYGSDQLDLAGPLFDVNFLGLGPDGHTASLFPGTQVLAERVRWAAAVIGAKEEARITLTYPTLESSRHVVFLVEGAAKRDILGRFLKGDASLPAARLHPSGETLVFADREAAGEAA
jgi:6-phosphogluconolactonase